MASEIDSLSQKFVLVVELIDYISNLFVKVSETIDELTMGRHIRGIHCLVFMIVFLALRETDWFNETILKLETAIGWRNFQPTPLIDIMVEAFMVVFLISSEGLTFFDF